MACRKGMSFLEPPNLSNPQIENTGFARAWYESPQTSQTHRLKTQVSPERGMPQWPAAKGATMTCRKGSRNVPQRVFLPRAPKTSQVHGLKTQVASEHAETAFRKGSHNGVPQGDFLPRALKTSNTNGLKTQVSPELGLPQWPAAKEFPS